jgi:hypothetical protein
MLFQLQLITNPSSGALKIFPCVSFPTNSGSNFLLLHVTYCIWHFTIHGYSSCFTAYTYSAQECFSTVMHWHDWDNFCSNSKCDGILINFCDIRRVKFVEILPHKFFELADEDLHLSKICTYTLVCHWWKNHSFLQNPHYNLPKFFEQPFEYCLLTWLSI